MTTSVPSWPGARDHLACPAGSTGRPGARSGRATVTVCERDGASCTRVTITTRPSTAAASSGTETRSCSPSTTPCLGEHLADRRAPWSSGRASRRRSPPGRAWGWTPAARRDPRCSDRDAERARVAQAELVDHAADGARRGPDRALLPVDLDLHLLAVRARRSCQPSAATWSDGRDDRVVRRRPPRPGRRARHRRCGRRPSRCASDRRPRPRSACAAPRSPWCPRRRPPGLAAWAARRVRAVRRRGGRTRLRSQGHGPFGRGRAWSQAGPSRRARCRAQSCAR